MPASMPIVKWSRWKSISRNRESIEIFPIRDRRQTGRLAPRHPSGFARLRRDRRPRLQRRTVVKAKDQRRKAKMAGIARIDQPHKHNHGFFVRVQHAGKIPHSSPIKKWRPAESPGRRPGTLPEASAEARTSPASKPALVGADTSPQRFVRDCRCAEMPAVARRPAAGVLVGDLEPQAVCCRAGNVFGAEARLPQSQTVGHSRSTRRLAEHGMRALNYESKNERYTA
jgi:hypothetical protein